MTDHKEIYKEKMRGATENLLTAEYEGAEHIAPDTYAWAKAKIYNCMKVMLHSPDDLEKLEEATDEAAAAAAQLLAMVREKSTQRPKADILPPEEEAVQVLDNEGGPAV